MADSLVSLYYPPVGFHFTVKVLGVAKEQDARFSEVGGLSAELTTEEVVEGGENRFVQKFPVRTKFPELVLKRGLLVGSELLTWVRACIEDFDITPRGVDVNLLDETHAPLVTWHLANAYPTKWAVSDLNAASNAVVVETMQLYYQRFTVEYPQRGS